MSKVIEFEDVREEILEKMKSKGNESGISEPVGLISGFMTQTKTTTLSTSVAIGENAMPMIACVGENSGRMYFFALGAIIDIGEI